MKIEEKLERPYNPQETESRIYALWESSGYFNPDNLPGKREEAFSILMPPTNANGDLHAGHALVMTIEDILVRFARMRGKRALWLPGTDHAGFETQVVYERKLEREGRSRFSLAPPDLYNEIREFTQKNRGNINEQIRKLGASCDWSREKFTLDPDIVQTVYRTFKKLADDGLLYRGTRIVNWCPKHRTSFSDLEIVDTEQADPLYYLKYGPFTIATTRPETKFGDKYVVMHPSDERYREYSHGQKIKLEWINGPVIATVIKDEAIDPSFGTGAMTITPWHDAADFAIAERHDLPREQIIGFDGALLPTAGEFAGQKISTARSRIVEKLREKGLLERVDESYRHTVRRCYKCETPIEPQVTPQWFVSMRPIAEKARASIERGEVVFVPEHYKKIVLHWLRNIADWNISRQIVWGIPIPAKICDACSSGMVDLDDSVKKCPSCGGNVRPDADTFDTWFSSGQWPFAALGYPDGADFKQFFPTDVLETAGEIIFFWVARMIMLSLYVTGKVPFRTIYLHGLVLDAHGKKMSKSKGNVIDPLTLTARYGTDALRMALIVGNTPGTSLALAEDRIRGYKNFANKIWNVARFILANTRDPEHKEPPLVPDDQKRIDELRALADSVTTDMEQFRLYLAAEKLYHYVWHTVADVIIEECKPALRDESEHGVARRRSAERLLREVLVTSLTLLHPFMPFVTEEIWSLMTHENATEKLLIVKAWPEVS